MNRTVEGIIRKLIREEIMLKEQSTCKEIKAPEKLDIIGPSIFLAGSIEMGKAINWQDKITKTLQNITCTILNPRRDDWDSTWEQKIENKKFREQVEWELQAQEFADYNVFYFDKDTKSPITLLELGLFCKDKKSCVCCPEGFYRKGNVDIVCNKYNVECVNTLEELIEWIKEVLGNV